MYTVQTLRALLERYGHPVKGTKAELIARIEELDPDRIWPVVHREVREPVDGDDRDHVDMDIEEEADLNKTTRPTRHGTTFPQASGSIEGAGFQNGDNVDERTFGGNEQGARDMRKEPPHRVSTGAVSQGAKLNGGGRAGATSLLSGKNRGHGDVVIPLPQVSASVANSNVQPREVRNGGLVERELEMSRKERELIERENALLRRELEALRARERTPSENAVDLNATIVDRRIKMTFAMIAEFISDFDGDHTKAETWLKKFHMIRQAHKLDDDAVRVLFYKKIKGKAEEWLETRPELAVANADNLLMAFKEMYVKERNKVELRDRFQKRKWGVDENFRNYVHEKTILGNLVPVEQSELLDYIIEGIPDQWLRDNAKIKCFTSVDALVKAYDQISLKGRRFPSDYSIKVNNNNNHSANVNKSSEKKVTETEPTFLRENRIMRKKCNICDSTEHRSFNCPDRNKFKKCFKCHEIGHVAYKCIKSTDSEKKECALIETWSGRYVKNVLLNGENMSALLDTGSEISLLRESQFVRLGKPELSGKRMMFKGIGSSLIQSLGKVHVELVIDNVDIHVEFQVVADHLIKHDILLGTNFFKMVEVNLRGTIATVRKLVANEIPEVFNIEVEELVNEKPDIKVGKNVTRENKELIEQMIEHYVPSERYEVGVEMSIMLKDEKPIYQPPRRLSMHEREIVNRQIDEWLEKGVIKRSSSEFASPIVLVEKSDGSTRLCVDYRKINKVVVRDRYPMPLIDDVLDALRGAKVFTTLDLENGFFHVPVEEGSRKYTSFVVPDGQYEFLKAPFGLCNSPAVFLRYINFVFRDLIREGVVHSYMDDLIIPARSDEEGILRLDRVFEVAARAGLRFKWQKCQFLSERVEYLGNIIENNCIRPSDKKIKAVIHFPEPRDVKEVQSFLGLTGYFRRFVKNYALIARPLTDLLRNDTKFAFGVEQKESFVMLKKKLTEDPVLRLYNPEANTELHTDASKIGIGAILLQQGPEDEKMHPVIFYSKKNSRDEEKYSSFELEVMAAVKAMEKFRVYLRGHHFTLVTDCKAFAQTMEKPDLCARIHRWTTSLHGFDYTVKHRPGKNMQHVDALSRHPPECYFVECNDGTLARVRRAQREDPEVRKWMTKGEDERDNGFHMQGGLLYRDESGAAKLVVPKALQKQIAMKVHEHGHFSAPKTTAMIRRDFWMPGAKGVAEKVVRNCILCILADRKYGKQEGWLHPLEKGSAPLQSYHIDHAGPLTTTKKKYNHLLVVVDSFSKFVWLYPVKSTGSAEVIERLKRQAAVFGNPSQITSDRGSAFTSEEFSSYCKSEGIEQHLTTTGVPRANGQVERVNRTVLPLLAKLAAPKAENWFKHVEFAQLCLNSVLHRSLKEIPFKVMFGVDPRVGVARQLLEELQRETLREFEQDRNEMRKSAANQIKKIQQENEKQFNKKRKEPMKYREGDLVAIRRTQQGPGLKIRFKFLGPYEVVKVSGKDRYVVQRVGDDEGPFKTRSAADSMKPWLENDSEDEEEERDEEVEETRYEEEENRTQDEQDI